MSDTKSYRSKYLILTFPLLSYILRDLAHALTSYYDTTICEWCISQDGRSRCSSKQFKIQMAYNKFFCHSQEVSAHFTDVTWVLTLTEVRLLPQPRILGMPWLGERVWKISHQFLTTSTGKGCISSDHISLIKASHRVTLNIKGGWCLGRGENQGEWHPRMSTAVNLLIYSLFRIQLVDTHPLFTKVPKVPFSASSGSQECIVISSVGMNRASFDPETNKLKNSVFCPLEPPYRGWTRTGSLQQTLPFGEGNSW